MASFINDNPVQLRALDTAFPRHPINTQELLDSLDQHCQDPAITRRARAIAHRLGIEERYLSRDLSRVSGEIHQGCDAPSLAGQALEKAAQGAKVELHDIDYLVGHTTTPHTLLPPNTAWVAEKVQFDSPYMELRQACTGFANALQISASMVCANGFSCVAILGSEVGSPYFLATNEFAETEQLINYVQMGDGAAAALVGAPDGSGRALISDIFMGHAGNGRSPGLSLNGGGSFAPECGHGLPIFSHDASGVREHGPALFQLGARAVEARGYSLADFRYIIPHQANGRMATPLAKYLNLQRESIYSTAHKYGNLGSVAIWAALADLLEKQLLEENDRVLVLGAEATKYMYGGFIYTH